MLFVQLLIRVKLHNLGSEHDGDVTVVVQLDLDFDVLKEVLEFLLEEPLSLLFEFTQLGSNALDDSLLDVHNLEETQARGCHLKQAEGQRALDRLRLAKLVVCHQVEEGVLPAECKDAPVGTLSNRLAVLCARIFKIDTLQQQSIWRVNMVDTVVSVHAANGSHLLDGELLIFIWLDRLRNSGDPLRHRVVEAGSSRDIQLHRGDQIVTTVVLVEVDAALMQVRQDSDN